MQELQAVDCVRPMWKPCEYVSTVMLYVDELINLCQTQPQQGGMCSFLRTRFDQVWRKPVDIVSEVPFHMDLGVGPVVCCNQSLHV